MAVSKQPQITPETSSGEGLEDEISARGEAKWKRFHPFRVVRKIFRRRIKREGTVTDASKKSWSTSELQSVDDDGTGKCEVTSPLKIGLSVSHDSIFSPENNANAMGSETLSVTHGSSLSIHQTSIKNMFKDELFSRVRARRDSDDDDDIGLPRSPCTSPTTVDVLTQGLKEKSSKSFTTCSAGSLISMGSSENDEDSAGQSSGHSSRMSLIDKRSFDSDVDMDVNQSVPLNHNAAHHKIAIKPKRTYGLPRRRMNQIAAAKLNTLPSTPEVVEDSSRLLQKVETFEVVRKIQESNASIEKENVSMQMSEKKIMHTSFSCSEMADFTSALIQDKTSSESNVNIIKRNKDYESNFFQEEKVMKSDKTNLITSEQLDISRQNEIIGEDSKEKFKLNNLQQNFIEQNEFIYREVKYENTSSVFGSEILKNTFVKSDNLSPINLHDALQNHTEEPIKVSSLVRSIERSESSKVTDESGANFDRSANNVGQHIQNVKIDEKLDEINNIDPIRDIIKQISLSNACTDKANESLLTTVFKDNPCSIPGIPEDSKLNIDCEFVLKPVKKDFTGDSDLITKENLFEKEGTLTSSTFFEEESIMSSKTLSLGAEEGGIFVSHHASTHNDLKDMLVTEAHNYAAVEEKNEVFIQCTTLDNDIMKKESNEPWVSSVGFSSSKTDVTVSSSSTLCDSKMNEDKITISVNSKQAAKHTIAPQGKNIKQPVEEYQKPAPLIKSDVSKRVVTKEKETNKQKSFLSEGSNNPTSVQNINSQKRVSVEIVPFSQRMKERKYQPITFSGKETNTDKEKKTSNVTVERKLSDRKLSTKNKEVDKSNSRHSFSGVITSDKKEATVDKKPSKPEKVQYPVQIRIHKSAPTQDVKEIANKPGSNKERKSSFNKNIIKDEKLQSPKLKEKNAKIDKQEKLIPENAKWEVKIQPAANYSTSHIVDESCSSVTSEKNNQQNDSQVLAGNEQRELHLNNEHESLNTKSDTRVQKEAPISSDEPEPELLRVFARRSIKQKHCDKVNDIEEKPVSVVSSEDSVQSEKKGDNKEVISVSHTSTVIKISETTKANIKHDLKKKSKSFSEKEKVIARSVSPLKEINLIRRESPTKLTLDTPTAKETSHPRQRVANVPDLPVSLPPDVIKSSLNELNADHSPQPTKEEKTSLSPVPPSTGSVNGNLPNLGTVKENQEILNGKEAHAPSWLQLAQQRRELREQRERLLLGGSPNSFMDASNKPSRSSKVWDMVNNFQKLQMT
ncbi:uncharacterized protein [Parasteatoda tepidariorum]|uniref:uncharacterized protein isoform X1 n=2 Tax=Parasteatoda tepidariorum TaxID=114398 RepID=UPI001C71E5E9|nr:uncharacterized protein LOC107450095 isoform X1 [Parasteatoda tepidariorum]